MRWTNESLILQLGRTTSVGERRGEKRKSGGGGDVGTRICWEDKRQADLSEFDCSSRFT